MKPSATTTEHAEGQRQLPAGPEPEEEAAVFTLGTKVMHEGRLAEVCLGPFVNGMMKVRFADDGAPEELYIDSTSATPVSGETAGDAHAAAADKPAPVALSRQASLARDYTTEHTNIADGEDPLRPYTGAMPKFLKEPSIATARETETATRLACRTISQQIMSAATGVLLIMGQDSSYSPLCRKLLDAAEDSEEATVQHPTVDVVLGNDWLHTMPRVSKVEVPPCGERLLVFVGTPGLYLGMSMQSNLIKEFDRAHNAERLIVVTKGAIMLPLGAQQQNIFGADPERVLEEIIAAAEARGGVRWGHGPGTKATLVEHALHHLPTALQCRASGVPAGETNPPPTMPLLADVAAKQPAPDESFNEFDSFAEFVKYTNRLKLALPSLPVINFWDTGLLVFVVQGFVVRAGCSMLTDRDGLAILREASIGHTMSKLHQVAHVEPIVSRRGVYSFFLGDGAARLNSAIETVFQVLESFRAKSYITVFIFNNKKWAIEDNLTQDTEEEHKLHNEGLYQLLAAHPNVQITSTLDELHSALADITAEQNEYAMGKVGPQIKVVVVQGLNPEAPVLLGGLERIRCSPEMALMQSTLGDFAAGCESKVPLYGCSAFEYIQHLKIFLDKTPEGKNYQYTCGRTDIHAAQMCGFDQPNGRCVLFINDVYGINSLGESLRMVQSGFGGKQLLVFIWHPPLKTVADHFHVHRPPMVWPSPGSSLAKYFVRKESDALFVDFHFIQKDHFHSRAIPIYIVAACCMLLHARRRSAGTDAAHPPP
eukprot:COSAG05_NODE_784_length_7362_cov_36.913810_4_plen_767_part_00